MRIQTAKDYSVSTGYPKKTLCRLIRQGEIPHEKNGAGYLIDADVVDQIIADRMDSNAKSQPVTVVQPNSRSRSRPKSINDYLEALKAI